MSGTLQYTLPFWTMRRLFSLLTGKCCGNCHVFMASQKGTSSSCIQKTYEKYTCIVIHSGVLSELVEMLTGVRQGCLVSPFLFLLVIDWIMRETTEKHRHSIQWTLTTRIEDLDFADDIVLLSSNHQGMQSKVTWLTKPQRRRTSLGSANPRQRRRELTTGTYTKWSWMGKL